MKTKKKSKKFTPDLSYREKPINDLTVIELLERAEKLLKNAEPGPWCWEATGEKENCWSVGYALDGDEIPYSGEIRENDYINDETGEYEHDAMPMIVEHIADNGSSSSFANAAFIAAAPELVARLLEEYKTLLSKYDDVVDEMNSREVNDWSDVNDWYNS